MLLTGFPQIARAAGFTQSAAAAPDRLAAPGGAVQTHRKIVVCKLSPLKKGAV
jgi:hypothetical protein